MDKAYLEKRKEELEAEFNKGAEALRELQKQGVEISEKLKMIQGAHLEVVNQLEVKNGGEKDNKKEDDKKGSKKK